eukprot:12935660-Prorocentrum_lima.AAC.1
MGAENEATGRTYLLPVPSSTWERGTTNEGEGKRTREDPALLLVPLDPGQGPPGNQRQQLGDKKEKGREPHA